MVMKRRMLGNGSFMDLYTTGMSILLRAPGEGHDREAKCMTTWQRGGVVEVGPEDHFMYLTERGENSIVHRYLLL